MPLSPIWNFGIFAHLSRIPEEERGAFHAHQRRTNARRLSIVFSITLIGATAFCLMRLGMACTQYHHHSYARFLIMDLAIISTALFLHTLSKHTNPTTNSRAHRALLFLTLMVLPGLLNITAGMEYISAGGINPFYLTAFALSTSVILSPAALILAHLWCLGVLFATVLLLGGSFTSLLAGNSHLVAILFLSIFISRASALGFIRDFFLMRELEATNNNLKLEIFDKEEALRRLAISRKEFKDTFEFAPDPYLLTDTSGTLLRINRSAADLMHLSPKKVKGLSLWRLPNLSQENHNLISRTIRQTALCGHSGPCQLSAIHISASPSLYLELHAALIHVEELERILIIARDTTHRKEREVLLQESRKKLEERVQCRTRELERINIRLKEEITDRIATEAALAQAEHYYRMLVENMNEGLAIFDPHGRFTYANECLCTMTGYSREELMGQDSSKVMLPEDRSLSLSRQNEHHQGDRTPYEARMASAQGGVLHIQVSPEPIMNEKGHFKGSFVVITNITRLKEMDAALRKSEEQAKALLNASSDAAVLLTPTGKILEANNITCTLLKTSRHKLVGCHAMEIFNEMIQPWHRDLFNKAMEQCETNLFEESRPSGNCFEVTIHPIPHNERVDLVAIFARNITELKRAEKQIRTLSQELIKAQESERQRIAMDLHDNVAQDLATLKIGWDTLFDNQATMPPGTQERIQHLSRLLKNSIQSIRGLAYNLQPPELEQLGLITAISRFCDEQSTRYGASIDLFTAGVRELTLTFDIQINLYRLVQEALTNVRKHASATRVTIRLTASHPMLILYIEDNGKGFSVKKRLAEAIMEKRMGVRSMEERVSLLGGTMKLTSAPEEGTRIRIEVPIAIAQPHAVGQ